ncbi:hypothetical protein PSEUBRA_005005 [Kalmanozyma brasiliensis GHG001]|uniref:Uncharacterized protein n=1 Tax=Kalmanozyma brasiliensis (strain GHG001) TaxID=1365824 RepID=V5ESL1_KALBG|nr:uncharacterized protein PSEUBRA_005005 [Kalmanozyma brasiliensis GHG001]EST05953.1 hypothetical protein PSEUBRA_005005 [Kalmanozyma brasiliensis GHG001]
MVATRRSASGSQAAPKQESGTKREAPASKPAKSEPDTKKPKTTSSKDANAVLSEQQSKLESYHDALTWLHSSAAWKLAHPDVPEGKGETDLAAEGGETVRTPPEPYENKRQGAKDAGHLSYPNSDLTSFQTLLCAILLSKPISHTLGLRAIETLLNKPYYFHTAKDLIDAGNEGRRAALWEARTQHKEKTAVQLGNLAEGITKLCEGAGKDGEDTLKPILDKALDQAKDKNNSFDVAEAVKSVLTKEVNGLGPGGVEIFLRRVQSQWPQVFPFADEKALNTAVQFDLIKQSDLDKGREAATQKLAEKVAEHVGFPLEDAKTDDEEGECGRWWFVRTLDVLIGLDIEKKVDEAVKQAKSG